MYYVYLIQSLTTGKSYVGFTSKSPDIRIKEHNGGSNSFTGSGKPWKLVYYESFLCVSCARLRERFLKTGVGKKLVKLIIEHYK